MVLTIDAFCKKEDTRFVISELGIHSDILSSVEMHRPSSGRICFLENMGGRFQK
jgi:hypothetical protein